MKVFKNILSFLGVTDSTKKVDLTEEQIEQIDTALGELSTIKAERDQALQKIGELETAATASATKITELNGQVSSLTTENSKQKTEIERLGQLDAGKITTTKGQSEKKDDDKPKAIDMPFQKELMKQV